jgi:hypothetical protein
MTCDDATISVMTPMQNMIFCLVLMAILIPDYIEERIRRQATADLNIVPRSTPVVSFGNAETARVATLGLNPSRVEFLDNDGLLLEGPERRLATHESLGTRDLTGASLETVVQVFNDCNSYFERQPYWRWFKQLGPVLRACGASYCDGSACHLDLVQWATDPTWSKLRPAAIRKKLIAEDAKFLANQVQRANLHLLLVNGSAVLRQLCRSMAYDLELEEIKSIEGYAKVPTRLFAGQIFGRVRVAAWSTNLQSSFGVTTELRDELPNRITAIA